MTAEPNDALTATTKLVLIPSDINSALEGLCRLISDALAAERDRADRAERTVQELLDAGAPTVRRRAR